MLWCRSLWNPRIIEQAYELTHPNGTTVCVGVPRKGNNISIYSLPLHFDKRITGSFPIAGSIPLDFHHKSWDYEQIPRPGDKLWYLGVANYTRLYALAASDIKWLEQGKAGLHHRPR